MVVRAHQMFHFFRKITWFLGINRVLSKFRYGILHNLISILVLSNYKKKSVRKSQF